MRERGRRVLAGEDGFAVVIAMMVSTLLLLFTVGILATGVHLAEGSMRDRSWNSALQVAEAGIEHAAHQLSTGAAYSGTGSTPMPMPGGEVEILVDLSAPGRATVYATGWVPSKSSTSAVSRRIRVTFVPGGASTFDVALHSDTALVIKTGNVIEGSVLSNASLLLENGSSVRGEVVSTTGGVTLANGSTIEGDVHSGGSSGISIGNIARVTGSAYARSMTCTGTAASGEHGITGAGTVMGAGTAWGSISATVVGLRSPSTCLPAIAEQPLPAFRWDPDLYVGETEHTTTASFRTYLDNNRHNLRGVHYVWVPACSSAPSATDSVLAFGGAATITDAFSLVTNCRIELTNNVVVSAGDDAKIELVSLNTSTSPPAFGVMNSFDVLHEPTILIFTYGLLDLNNNFEVTGGVFAGAIDIMNGFEVTYDETIAGTLGFGDVRYARETWVECRAAATGTDC